ncbi:MAG: Trm112 family protein [Burkholderiaceae bacterium]
MKPELLSILVCPLCKGPLEAGNDTLICRGDRLVFPIRDGIPCLLEDQADPLRGEAVETPATPPTGLE